VTEPQLFSQAPATLIANLEGVVDHFRERGLTMRDYLRAAVEQPSLFTLSPSTVVGNIEGVVEHFREYGLSLSEYLFAAVKKPQLFYQSPAKLQSNIEGVVDHFREHGLTLRVYLRAALLRPTLFTQSPATLTANIESVTGHFRDLGLKLPDYLRAAVKQPQLFYQTPATIIGNVNLLIALQREGLVIFNKDSEAHSQQPLRPLFDFLIANPAYFCLATDNYALREIYAHTTGDRPAGQGLVRRPRHQVESQLTQALEHGSPRIAVPKEPSPSEGGDRHRHARNLLLRALIREGLVKGSLER
jgi:hypothetical protein